MTEELNSLVIQALDDLADLTFHRQLLEMAQEALKNEAKALDRIELLLDLFLSRFDCYREDINTTLSEIQDLVQAQRIKKRLAKQAKDSQEGG